MGQIKKDYYVLISIVLTYVAKKNSFIKHTYFKCTTKLRPIIYYCDVFSNIDIFGFVWSYFDVFLNGRMSQCGMLQTTCCSEGL